MKKRVIIITGPSAIGKTTLRYFLDRYYNFKFFIMERWADSLYVYSFLKGDNFTLSDVKNFQEQIRPLTLVYILLVPSSIDWYMEHLKKFRTKTRSFELKNFDRRTIREIVKRFEKIFNLYKGSKIKIYVDKHSLNEIFEIVINFIERVLKCGKE